MSPTPPAVPVRRAGPRVLLARPDHLGDVLLTLPAAVALRAALPHAHVAYLVSAHMRRVPRYCPEVDEVLEVPFPPIEATSEPGGWRAIVARHATALRGRFDVALRPRPSDPWSGAVVAAAGIPTRVGYDLPVTRPYLTRALAPPWRLHAVRHALEVARAACTLLGAAWPAEPERAAHTCFVPTEEEEAHASDVAHRLGGDLVLLHPGSGWRLKNWPPASWGAVAAALGRGGVTPVVVGGPGETQLVDRVVRASEGRAIGIAGTLSLGALAALQRRARLVIATDSGALHLAAMMGAPVIGLYGPADPEVFAPWPPSPERQRVVRVQLPCSPCGTLIDPPCGAEVDPLCVTDITVEAVLAASVELLGVRRPRSSRPKGRRGG